MFQRVEDRLDDQPAVVGTTHSYTMSILTYERPTERWPNAELEFMAAWNKNLVQTKIVAVGTAFIGMIMELDRLIGSNTHIYDTSLEAMRIAFIEEKNYWEAFGEARES